MVQTLNLKLFGRLSNKVIIIITGMRVAPRIEVSGSESKRPGLKIVSASCKLVQRLRVFKEHLAEDSAVAWEMRSGSSAHRFTVAPSSISDSFKIYQLEQGKLFTLPPVV